MKKPLLGFGVGLLAACHTAVDGSALVAQAASAAMPIAPATEQSLQSFVADFVPPDYRLMLRRSVTVDGATAAWIRYQPATHTALRLGEAHFSVLWSAQGYLKGFTDMHLPPNERHVLVDKTTAQTAADAFLRRYAPDLELIRK